jgi:hypothetical protein
VAKLWSWDVSISMSDFFVFFCVESNPGPCTCQASALPLSYSPVLSVWICCCCWYHQAQSFTLARQVLYHFSHAPSPFMLWLFRR